MDKLLDNKRTYIARDGEEYLNLNAPTVNINDIQVNGYIKVNDKQQTSEKNVYACGDIASKEFKQVVTACADGARAGNSCIGG